MFIIFKKAFVIKEEKLQKIIDVQGAENLDKESTVNLFGFERPCYLIETGESLPVKYEDTPYPYMRWITFKSENMLQMKLG